MEAFSPIPNAIVDDLFRTGVHNTDFYVHAARPD